MGLAGEELTPGGSVFAMCTTTHRQVASQSYHGGQGDRPEVTAAIRDQGQGPAYRTYLNG